MITLDNRCLRLLVAGTFSGLCMAGVTTASLSDGPEIAPALQKTDATAVAELPEASAVFENAIKAMGGREALENIKSSMVKATMKTPMGEMAIETYFLSPNRFFVKQVFPGMGEVSMGSDGATTWVLDPMRGYQLIEADDAETMRDQASMHNLVMRIEKEFSELKTVDRLKFHDQDCYKLRMTDKDGQEQFAFFNAENHFMTGLEIKQATPQGASTSTMRFEEWKTYGDVKLFTRMVVTQMGINLTMELTEIELDEVDKALFTLPAEVKKLADERREAEAAKEAAEESPS